MCVTGTVRHTVHALNVYKYFSSTAKGGGVAEMLPRTIACIRELGGCVNWLVIEPKDNEKEKFFATTKVK